MRLVTSGAHVVACAEEISTIKMIPASEEISRNDFHALAEYTMTSNDNRQYYKTKLKHKVGEHDLIRKTMK